MRTTSVAALWLAATLSLVGCVAGDDAQFSDDESSSDGKADGAAVSIANAIRGLRFTLPSSALRGRPNTSLSKGSYLAIDLPVAGYAAIEASVVTTSHVALKTRGEAHVTVITPPEFSALSQKLSMADLDGLAKSMNVGGADLQAQCVGVGAKGLADQTVYVVVTSQRIAAYRAQVATTFRARGGSPSAFDAASYHPHATIGFTKRDLHESDGVIKDVASCPTRDNLLVP